MKKLLIVLTIASLLSVCSSAINAKERNHHADLERVSLTSLNLSIQQKQDIKQIRKETKQDLNLYRGEQRQLKQSIQALMRSQVWDELAVKAAFEEQMATKMQSMLILAKSKNKVFNQLTEVQKSQLITERLEKKKATKDRNGKSAQKKMLRLTKALSLTAEQQTQLIVMMEVNKTLRLANKKESMTIKSQLASVVQAASFDEDAWLAIHSDNQPQKLDMAVRKAKARFDVLSVLNEEQREKFAAIMKENRKGKIGKKAKMRKSNHKGNHNEPYV
jgi:Spy/CpxP family protein refolding chaperone